MGRGGENLGPPGTLRQRGQVIRIIMVIRSIMVMRMVMAIRIKII